jgi:hypothetical protein
MICVCRESACLYLARFSGNGSLAGMQHGTVILLRLFFIMLFLGTLFAGLWVLKNYNRFCGVDESQPSENSSARAYSRMQIIVVLAHALLLFGAFALWIE